MKNSEFCHLHVHNEYSHLDGFGSSKEYVKRAKELGFEYLALTNHGNVDGCIEWQEECIKADIKPITGCEIYVTADMEGKGEAAHMLLLVKSQAGWKELLRLLTRANMDGFYRRPRVDFKLLLESDLSGFEIMTACANSFIYLPGGIDFIYSARKQTNVWLEIMPHCYEGQVSHNEELRSGLGIEDFDFVATNDCHYILPEHEKAQEVLLAIQRGAKWNDPGRWRFEIGGLHLRSADEMNQAFKVQGLFDRKEILDAMRNTIKVAEECSQFRIEKKQISLPSPPSMKGDSEPDSLDRLCCESKKWNDDPEYVKRYNEEFDLIEKKGFCGYFLIVFDFLNWCRENDIEVGPGRGSVGGSLIAYYLHITEVDPIEHDLLFSRFIIEDRIDWPDIDIDIEKKERQRGIEYLRQTYGEKNTCGISTVSRLNGKGIVRDVGRVFDIPYTIVDEFAKSITETEKGAIEDAIGKGGALFQERYPEEVKLMIALEGTIKTRGQHAAGVIISSEDLTDGSRCNFVDGKKEMPVCNWDMQWVEHQGLMKLDVLGLATLSMIKECTRLIGEKGENIDLSTIDMEDKKVFDTINNGETSGLFQISARALSELCRQIHLDNFNDLVASLALVRPGPFQSGMTEQYVKRKRGGRWKKDHPIYEDITKDTFGLLVYQEQVMQTIYRMAGLPYAEADKIRKVIAKKRDVAAFEPYKKKFMEGCQKQKTFSEKEAATFWEGLLEWASYGFNKCLSGDTVVTRSSFNQYTGRKVTLKDLYLSWHTDGQYEGRGLSIMQMDDDGRCRPATMVGIYYQGVKPVFKITTQTGKQIKATFNHRLYSYDGYKRIEELNVGDRLAIMGNFQKTITEKKGQKWKSVNNKGKRGFQSGEDNPSYVDGRSDFFNSAKKIALQRSKGFCEKCGKKKMDDRFEYAHVQSIESLCDDYSKYHSPKNILYLCNGCHKKLDYEKGERKKRYSTGYPIYFDSIISIEPNGEEEVFDVEMEGPNHNFAANDIISHNSHSVEYSVISYRTAWLKTYYPLEFFCASLTYGEFSESSRDPGKHKQSVIDEAADYGFSIYPPKIGISDCERWTIKGEALYAPFIEIKGVGGKQAEKLAVKKEPKAKKNGGFFSSDDFDGKLMPAPIQNKGDLVISEIMAHDPDAAIPIDIQKKYFDFIFPAAKVKKFYCIIEGEKAPFDSCVIDDGDYDGCKCARKGMKKEQCRFWRQLPERRK